MQSKFIQRMKIFNSSHWSVSPHCWDHVVPDSSGLKDEHRECVLILNGKTYWPASLISELEYIIVEAAQKIEDEGSWIQTVRAHHKSLGWKLYTYKGIELHLSVTLDDNNTYWVHAYPTEKQIMSGRSVLYL